MSFKNWSQRGDSNPRPAVYETAALPLSYAGPLESIAGQQWQIKSEWLVGGALRLLSFLLFILKVAGLVAVLLHRLAGHVHLLA